MEKLELGVCYDIHCFKHDSSIHKYWDEAILLEINEDYLVFGNDCSKVFESDGRTWRTKEPAIMFFYKHNWFNIVVQMKKSGYYYYCNMASPYVIDGYTIKYIDYDLDLRVFPNGSFKVLDRGEYKANKKKMQYGNVIDFIIGEELTKLINMTRNNDEPFNRIKIEDYYNLYLKYKKNAN